jgi:hypothetical protein
MNLVLYQLFLAGVLILMPGLGANARQSTTQPTADALTKSSNHASSHHRRHYRRNNAAHRHHKTSSKH